MPADQGTPDCEVSVGTCWSGKRVWYCGIS